jgi:putative endonuclease
VDRDTEPGTRSQSSTGARAERGALAEAAALAHLQTQGLTLLTRNHREKFGELDIVMEDGECVVFVEVRYRSSDRWGGALASVNPAKQHRLINAARSYLKRNSRLEARPCRFDVVAVEGDPTSPRVRWVPRAFGLG